MGETEVSVALAKYDYTAEGEGELTIRKNDKLVVLDDRQPWWKVQNDRAEEGYVPSNYLVRKDSVKGKKNIIDNLKSKMLNKAKPRTSESSDSTQGDLQSPKLMGKSGAKVVMVAAAKFKYVPQRDDEVEMNRGDQILVYEMENDGWWRGENTNGNKVGWFPSNYVEKKEVDSTSAASEYADPTDVMESKQIICKVRTMYPFSSQSPEELSFDKDVVLDIIEKPKDDPDWWQARKSTGETGLVPRNYVEELVSSILTPGPEKPKKKISLPSAPVPATDLRTPAAEFLSKDWYHGPVSRNDCENLLNSYAGHGEFLVRNSESKPGDFSLSMKAPGRIKHFKIMSDKGSYIIGQRTFPSMDDLIAHYMKAPIFTTDAGQKMFLSKPFSKAASSRNGQS